MKPVISVMMLVYNHEIFIREALDSILMQITDLPYEIVIGDDASQDNTALILEEYRSKYPEIIRVISHPKNIGAMNNHKQTMQACRGEFVAICEGDDYWSDRHKLKKQHALLDSVPELSFVCHRVDYYYQKEKRMEPWGAEYFTPGQLYRKITIDTLFEPYLVKTVSVMYRASALNNEVAVKQDFFKDLFLFAMLLANGEAWFVNENMAVYRIHDQGIWSGQGSVRNLYSNVMTGIHLNRYFKGENATINLYTYHQLKNLFDALQKESSPNYKMINEVSKPLLENFGHHLRWNKKLKHRWIWLKSKAALMLR